MKNIFLGIIYIFLGGIIIILKIKKKWIYKKEEDRTMYDNFLSIKGWFGAIGLIIMGIAIILNEII